MGLISSGAQPGSTYVTAEFTGQRATPNLQLLDRPFVFRGLASISPVVNSVLQPAPSPQVVLGLGLLFRWRVDNVSFGLQY